MKDETWYGSGLAVGIGLLLGMVWFNPWFAFIAVFIFLFTLNYIHKDGWSHSI